jgi:hypothetical protein
MGLRTIGRLPIYRPSRLPKYAYKYLMYRWIPGTVVNVNVHVKDPEVPNQHRSISEVERLAEKRELPAMLRGGMRGRSRGGSRGSHS